MKLVASCAFGLEAIVARELQGLGYATKTTGPGQVRFDGEWPDVCKTNLWLRCADRVSILVAEFECPDFDALFDTTKQTRWDEFVSTDGKIHVTGGSVKSQLTSVPAIQRTVKKAIVEQMMAVTNASSLPEDGPLFRVHVALRNDKAELTMDTTGPSLHKRGYREISTKAPLKETMAAALVLLSFWRPDRPLIDPFCGGGTIPIEAAMIGRKMAPGLKRSFVSEEWPEFSQQLWQDARKEAEASRLEGLPERILGTDIHGGALSLARRNADLAGVPNDIHFHQQDFRELTSKRQYGCVVTNPPYGERIDPGELRELYESIPLVLRTLPTWSHFILTAYPGFEKLIGKQADRRRKLYNGRIECTYFQFHGPRPSKSFKHDSTQAVDTTVSGDNVDSQVDQTDRQVELPDTVVQTVDSPTDHADTQVDATVASVSRNIGTDMDAEVDAGSKAGSETNSGTNESTPIATSSPSPSPIQSSNANTSPTTNIDASLSMVSAEEAASKSIQSNKPIDSSEQTQPNEASDSNEANKPSEPSVSSEPDRPREKPAIGPVFGGVNAKAKEQAELFANRLRKRARHLRRWPTRRGITCYRLYEKDIPEIPLVVDRYEDCLHIVEFERPHDRDLAQHADWLELMATTAAETLELPPENVFVKSRHRQQGMQQHEKFSNTGQEQVVREGGLKFYVNLSDYTDTGLFLDHRPARSMIRDMCKGKRVLNLFAYTGSFSVYAVDGGADKVTTVDLSATYLDWGKRNFQLNGFSQHPHEFIRADTQTFVEQLPAEPLFDIIVCDPPTFSNSKRTEDVWDVQRQHAQLLNELKLRLERDGTIFFSSNFRRLKLDEEAIQNTSIREISKKTVPEDFRNQRIHRSWLITHAGEST